MAKELLNRAIEELGNLNDGEEFLVKDLFKGYEWKRIPLNKRLRLGVLFLNEISSHHEHAIEILDKTSSNQQVYKIKQSIEV
ncbi:single-stranded DNA-binding protein [Fictibacillus sp. B-59209]|uniref:single-stranded DNA-binding protein n=1 Tax=Fictibacillus sp. B-59209 TaxID=3024873 RepID=UPI002E24F4B0|nr:single-stranded DNA-binding protein [Fictibacillus sp. B-59209]